MTSSTLKKIQSLYANNLDELGVSSESVGWPDSDKHTLRFKKLFANSPDLLSGSLNDLGCGYGAVLDFLQGEGITLARYNAYDIVPQMLESIDIQRFSKTDISKFDQPRLETVADFSITSGIFNVCYEENKKTWTQYILDTLHNLDEYSTHGFSFNLLSSYVDYQSENLFYGDPLFFFDYCKKHFSPLVSLHHDYPLWEWTIVVTKP
jgi:hypothetical protein